MKRIIGSIIVLVLISAMGYGVWFLWQALPIISGYGAKNMCSCVYLSNQSPEKVRREELGDGLLQYGTFEVDTLQQLATGSVFGLAKKVAIYRPGIGCTLLNEITKEELAKQQLSRPMLRLANRDTIAWPMGDRLPDSLPKGIDENKLKAAVAFAFAETDPKQPRRTRGFLVLYKGQIIAEQYANGYDMHTPQLGWSMTKSMTSALIGLLIAEGKLQLNEPAPIPEWREKKDGHEKITLRHLLQQTSGLNFEERYDGPSSATNMLFKKANMGLYTASLSMREAPGSRFYYSSGNTNILSTIIRTTLGEEDYYAYPYQALFWKIGMMNTVIEPDAGGTPVGSSYGWATPRDWARFGLLFAQKGNWMGEQILPSNWVDASIQPASVAPMGEYGFQWWLNAGAKNNSSNRRMPSVPTDAFSANGHEGQYVVVVPSKSLIVVRLGQTPGDSFDINQLVAKCLAAVE